jgi:hypothetical protein
MRRALLAALLLTVPAASAEFGAYGEDGWPIAVDGTSTNPFPGVSAHDLDDALAAAGDPLNKAGDATVYPYWPLLTAEILRMTQDHPDRVKLHTAGKSTAGLDLYMLEIADFAAIEAGTGLPLEQREVIWIDGGTHSNEYSGVYFTLSWAQFLVEEYESNATAKWIVDNRHSWVMPMVNPDGSHAFGRLNAMGVNINRNYPVIWDGEGHDALMNNRGPSPASEVETRANIEWFNITRPDYYASIHCCGNLWLYPYGQEGIDPIDNAMLAEVCKQAFPTVPEACGPIWSTIYPASGSSVDTAYEFAGAVAYGYEMSGRGAVSLWGQPITFETIQAQEIESWTGVLHAALNVHRYGAYPVVSAVAADGGGLVVTVRNEGLGELAGATVELMFPQDGSSKAYVPNLRPGDEATLRLPCEEDGLHELRLDYAKRLVPNSNRAVKVQSVLLQGPGATESTVDTADFFVERPEEVPEADAPGVAPVLLLVALAALALVARRR